MRILKLDLNKMRRHRYKHLPHFRTETVDRELLVQMPELIDFLKLELFKSFVEEMQGRRAWNPKPVEYDIFMDYDIDFNREKIGISERFIFPERRDT